eukprot:GHUV01047251.1.p1 GENE.GHUV01047251.1~~GHUV01047251.1.p1  ORF type:complete len:108 (-),score=15.37 GHUV01047251.1:520-843(-)
MEMMTVGGTRGGPGRYLIIGSFTDKTLILSIFASSNTIVRPAVASATEIVARYVHAVIAFRACWTPKMASFSSVAQASAHKDLRMGICSSVAVNQKGCRDVLGGLAR